MQLCTRCFDEETETGYEICWLCLARARLSRQAPPPQRPTREYDRPFFAVERPRISEADLKLLRGAMNALLIIAREMGADEKQVRAVFEDELNNKRD
jgi:hypothetical protein